MAQAEALERCWRTGQSSTPSIELAVDDEALVGRIVKRAEESTGRGLPVRKDDNPRRVRKRLRSTTKQTAPLIGYYYGQGQATSVDGMAASTR